MKKLVVRLKPMSVVFAGVLVMSGVNLLSPPVQAQDADKKVIRKTTDKSGFEKQLTEVDLMHQTASQLMSAGQWEEAIAELQQVVAAEPDRVSAWSDLAKCYKQLKQFDKAAEAYMSAHKIQPQDLDLLSNLGFAQLNAQQPEAAVETYNKMLAIDPVNWDANVHLGFLYEKSGDNAKAVPYYEKALEGNANDVQTMGTLANLYAELGETDKSVAMYERAIAAAPTPEQKNKLASKLGAALIAAKDFAKAAEVFGNLVDSSPENPAHQFNLGISLMQLDKFKEAAPHIKKVIELRPDYVQAYQQLAACYNETGRYEDAISMVKKGLTMTDQKGGLYCTWGRSLEKQQLYDEAIDVFQHAVNDPQWGSYAQKQIKRQNDLKKRAQMIKEQG